MSKFNISGDTETGEFVVSMNGETIANVSEVMAYLCEDYDDEDEMELHFRISSYEKMGDARKMTHICANKNKVEKKVEVKKSLDTLAAAIAKRLNK